MTSEDAEVARNVRRELAKRAINTTLIDVQVKAGKITLAGRVSHLREDKSANIRAEVEHVIKALSRERLVKGVYDQLHYVIDQDADENKEKDSRGRMRG